MCAISNTPRKCPGLRARLEKLQKGWSCKNRCHYVYGIPKYSLSNLRKSSSVNTVLSGCFFSVFSGGWSLDFLPLFWARTFRQYKDGKNSSHCYPDQTTKQWFSSLPAASPLFYKNPAIFQSASKVKWEANHWRQPKQVTGTTADTNLLFGVKYENCFPIIVTEIRTLISIQNFLKLWPSFYPLSPWHNLKTQRVCGIPSAFSNTLSPPVTISSLRNTGLNHFHLSMYVNSLYLIKTAQGSSTVSYSSLQILAWDYLLGKTTQEILKLWDTPFKRQSNSYYMSQQHICFLVNQPPATEKASLIDRVRRRSEPGLLCQLKLRNIFGN